MRIYLPTLGHPTPVESQENQEQLRRMRVFEGLGGRLVPVPGLLALDRVEMRGLVLQEVIEQEVPVAGSPGRFIPLAVNCCEVIQGIDGTPLLSRSPWSNDGNWQAGEPLYVFGEWDTEINPAPDQLPKPLERVHRPVLTTGEVTADGEVRVRAGKGNG